MSLSNELFFPELMRFTIAPAEQIITPRVMAYTALIIAIIVVFANITNGHHIRKHKAAIVTTSTVMQMIRIAKVLVLSSIVDNS